jgi:glycerophosphoryl diester phosphodiesterase
MSDLMRLVPAVVMVLAGALITSAVPSSQSPARILVAHRGASSYAPEHTLAAYRLAIEQGADYVEQDLAITKDGVLVCSHDLTLERTTDVETVFPDRFVLDAKGQKRWFVADFTLAEIKRLDAGSWFGAAFAGEKVLTWDEAVTAINGRAGMYPELKGPEMYRARNIDMGAVFAAAVARGKLDVSTPIRGRAPLVIQSFDEQTVRELAKVLPEVPRTMLIGSEAMAERWLSSEAHVRELASFATGIGPAKQLVSARPEVVTWAHAAGLTVTPYTFRSADTGAFADVTAEMRHFLDVLRVDALFTDNPDKFPRK